MVVGAIAMRVFLKRGVGGGGHGFNSSGGAHTAVTTAVTPRLPGERPFADLCFPMNAVEASRAAEKARRLQEKVEWDNIVKIFVIDNKKKAEALELLHAQPLATSRAGIFVQKTRVCCLFVLTQERHLLIMLKLSIG